VVEMLHHASMLRCVPAAIIARVPKACRSDLIGPATAPASTACTLKQRVPGAAQRGPPYCCLEQDKTRGALQTRDRRNVWRSRSSGAPP
jgi:hypothetical protein